MCGRPLCPDCVVEDVAADRVVCSQRCRQVVSEVGAWAPRLTDADLLCALEHPIVEGRRLWVRSLQAVVNQVAIPVALAAVAMAVLSSWWTSRWAPDSVMVAMPVLVLAAIAFAAVGVVLSREYAGLGTTGSLAWVAGRLVPWALTWAIVAVAVLAGYLLFILPGIYVALRLFWADEFALMHRTGPIASVVASWRLTRGSAGAIVRFQFILSYAQLVVWLPAFAVAAVGVNLVRLASPPEVLGAAIQAGFGALLVTVAYAFTHACEIVYFYGLRAEASGVLPEPAVWDPEAADNPAFNLEGRPLCPSCGTAYDPREYRDDLERGRCVACKGELVIVRG